MSKDTILLERRYAAVFDALADESIEAMARALGDDLRDALARTLALPAGFLDGDGLAGRLRGAMRSRRAHLGAGSILSDPVTTKTIDVLGDRSDDPSLEDLHEVLPAMVEEFGIDATRLMAVQYSVSLGGFRKLIASDPRFAIPVRAAAAPAPAAAADPAAQDEKRRLRAERKQREREQRARSEAQRRAAKRPQSRG
ncbi:MAG: hypothetical protein EBU70_00255 [Actinobacteria bacterium]|nr:hypothetical protein [Actinomycetota bacterium]